MNQVHGTTLGVGPAVGMVDRGEYWPRCRSPVESESAHRGLASTGDSGEVSPWMNPLRCRIRAHATELVDLHNVRVAQACADLGFLDEQANKPGRAGQVRQDPLDDQVALESLDAEAPRKKNFGHPALRKAADEFVFSEARRQFHRGIPTKSSTRYSRSHHRNGIEVRKRLFGADVKPSSCRTAVPARPLSGHDCEGTLHPTHRSGGGRYPRRDKPTARGHATA